MRQSRLFMLKNWLICLPLIFFAAKVAAAEVSEPLLDSAKEAYAHGKFDAAAHYYERIVNKGYEGPELFFNLGNAYFKSNNLAMAIVYYERAKKTNPWDDDIQFNLNLARQKLVDKVDNTPDFFIKKWIKSAVQLFSEKQWTVTLLLILWLSVASFVWFILSQSSSGKRWGFILGSLFALLLLPVLLVTSLNHSLTFSHNEAVVVASTVTTKGSPSEQGTNLFVLHEGTKVAILQTLGDWTEIKLPNGNTGWAKNSDLVII